VVTGKVLLYDPAGIVALAGINAGDPLVHKYTTIPPAGAGPLSVSIPVADVPALTLVGFTETDEMEACPTGAMESWAVLLTVL
jgi:hypothetical protein